MHRDDNNAEASAWTGAVLAPCVLVKLSGTEQPDPLPPLQATKATVRLMHRARTGPSASACCTSGRL